MRSLDGVCFHGEGGGVLKSLPGCPAPRVVPAATIVLRSAFCQPPFLCQSGGFCRAPDMLYPHTHTNVPRALELALGLAVWPWGCVPPGALALFLLFLHCFKPFSFRFPPYFSMLGSFLKLLLENTFGDGRETATEARRTPSAPSHLFLCSSPWAPSPISYLKAPWG